MMSFKATKKIALEEHFAIEETLQDSAGFVPPSYWVELRHRLLDIQERRIEEMDRNGIETMILSLNAPAVQAVPNRQAAYDLSRRANDFLAEQIAKRPDRFRGFAALPMQSPELASRELERCVKDFGFVGALVNGFSQVQDSDAVL
jgi:2,3-dihydroxybenzoate decarboxylase